MSRDPRIESLFERLQQSDAGKELVSQFEGLGGKGSIQWSETLGQNDALCDTECRPSSLAPGATPEPNKTTISLNPNRSDSQLINDLSHELAHASQDWHDPSPTANHTDAHMRRLTMREADATAKSCQVAEELEAAGYPNHKHAMLQEPGKADCMRAYADNAQKGHKEASQAVLDTWQKSGFLESYKADHQESARQLGLPGSEQDSPDSLSLQNQTMGGQKLT